jgi:hypothetical protein
MVTIVCFWSWNVQAGPQAALLGSRHFKKGLASFLGNRYEWKATLRDKGRKPGSAFPHLQIGLQAGQEVCPIPACLFICLINLGEPIVREE